MSSSTAQSRTDVAAGPPGALRKCPRDVGEKPGPLGRGRRPEKLDQRNQLTVSAVDRRLVRPIDKKGCGEDQVNCDDRGDHQCCDLSADTRQIEKGGSLHDRPFAGGVAASTGGG